VRPHHPFPAPGKLGQLGYEVKDIVKDAGKEKFSVTLNKEGLDIPVAAEISGNTKYIWDDLKGFIVDNLLFAIHQMDIIHCSTTKKIEMKTGYVAQVF
jgi:hypothetical protein